MTTANRLFVAMLALTAACTSSNVHDMKPGVHLGCNGKFCDAGEYCCGASSTAVSCKSGCDADAGDRVITGCEGPDDCARESPICCLTQTSDATCHAFNDVALCSTTCDYRAATGCGDTAITRRCSSAGDCAGSSTPYCCAASLGFGVKSLGVCADDALRDHYKSLGVGCSP